MKDEGIKIIELCRVATETEALPVQSLLRSYGIHCILQSHVTRSVYPFTVDGLAEVRIMVSNQDFEKARQILGESNCSE